MSNDAQTVVRVFGFKQTFELHPVRGDPFKDKVDAKGFLIDERGTRVMHREAIDWVTFAPAGSMGAISNTERVHHMIPDPDKFESGSRKLQFMTARWDAIKPAYEAWKQGQEIPVAGTPLGAWPGLSPEQADAFRRMGVRSVEELRDLSDSQVDRIPLPNVRDFRKQAALFIENLGASVAAEREAQKDQIIAQMQQQLAEMQVALSNKPAAAAEGDEVASLKAELDARGIEYDGRWAAPKLRALLQSGSETEAA